MIQTAQGFESEYTRPVDLKRLEFIHRHLSADNVRTILEFGCGSGNILSTLHAYNKVVGVEIDDQQLARALAKKLDVRKANATTYSEGELYDAVIISEVIAHVREPEALLSNAFRHLKPEGLLLLTTPNGYGYFELMLHHLNPRAYLRRSQFLRKLRGKPPWASGDGRDMCNWHTRKQLLRLTAAAGFSLIDQDNSDFITGSPRDLALASRLPSWAASGWFFALRANGPAAA